MNKFEKILKSFGVRGTLNPQIWDNPKDPENASIKTEISDALSEIAEEFLIYLGNEVFAEDIVLTGSLANYNWSEYSDFDLHIVIDYDNYGKQKDAYLQLFNLKKQVFNEIHNIKIKKHDVELYPQSLEEKHYSSGVYSIMDKKWITLPSKRAKDVDIDILRDKSKEWLSKISTTIKSGDNEKIKKTVDKLKEYRLSGLDKTGEFSYENLVFKFLRRSGVIEKLYRAMNKSLDKKLSLENE